METTRASGRRGRWRTGVRLVVMIGAASLTLVGCPQPVPPAPLPTPTSGPAAAAAVPSPAAAVQVAASPSPLPAASPLPSPSPAPAASPAPSPSPAAAVTAPPLMWTVITWEATRPFRNELFTFRATLNSDGSGGMREPAGNMGFPPNREKAAKVMALADRLAPFTETPPDPAQCKLEFRGRGQVQATEADKKEVAALIGC